MILSIFFLCFTISIFCIFHYKKKADLYRWYYIFEQKQVDVLMSEQFDYQVKYTHIEKALMLEGLANKVQCILHDHEVVVVLHTNNGEKRIYFKRDDARMINTGVHSNEI